MEGAITAKERFTVPVKISVFGEGPPYRFFFGTFLEHFLESGKYHWISFILITILILRPKNFIVRIPQAIERIYHIPSQLVLRSENNARLIDCLLRNAFYL